MIRWSLLLPALVVALCAQDETGTIRGRIVDAVTGQPVVGKFVAYKTSYAATDADGRYEMNDVLPGRGFLVVSLSDLSTSQPRRAITLTPGATVVADMRVYPGQSVSGRVTDEYGEPLPDVEVVLIGREYYMSKLRYYRRSLAITDEDGRYELHRVLTPDAGWLVWARMTDPLPAISKEPADPALRRQAFTPTFYPNAVRAGNAEVVLLGAGEQRTDVNIRMKRSPSLCAEAQVELVDPTKEARFWIEGDESLFGLDPLGEGAPGFPSGGQAAAEGKLRICGLTPGDHRLSVYTSDEGGPASFGVTQFRVAAEDVAGIQVSALPRIPLTGTVVWADRPPPNLIDGQVSVRVRPVDRSIPSSGARADLSIPGEFDLTYRTSSYKAPPGTGMLLGEYAVNVDDLPRPVYVRDIFYGGRSVRHAPLALGSELAGSTLRIVLDHDGGAVSALVRNDDGEPSADATVVAVPTTAATHVQLAEARVVCTTDQYGECTTAAIAPGEYLVMALERNYSDLSTETITALFDARAKATEVNIGPNATVEIELEARRLER